MQRLIFIAVCSMLFLVMAGLASAKEEGSASADWVQVVPGATHSIGLRADGTVWTWGSNEYGELGIGTRGKDANSNVPVQVSGLEHIKAVGAGAHYSLAVKSDGTVWAWGINSNAQLGDGSITFTDGYAFNIKLDANKSVPVQVRGITDVVSLTGGYATTYAIKKDGTVWKWGGDSVSGFTPENYDYTRLKLPVQVVGLERITSLSLGWTANLFINEEGVMYVEGHNTYGEQGNGTVTTRYEPPFQSTTIPGFEQVISASSGMNMVLAVKKDGTVWAWGNLRHTNNSDDFISVPMQIQGLTDVEAVASGVLSLILKKDGTVWSFRDFEVSNKGDNQWIINVEAKQVAGLSNIVAIEAGGGWAHFVAKDRDGAFWVWGNNTAGELGIGTLSYVSKPVQFSGDKAGADTTKDTIKDTPKDTPKQTTTSLPANNELKMSVRGQDVKFEFGTPFMDNNRTLFPLRDLLVALGVSNDAEHIIWNKVEQSVTAISGDVTIKLAVGKKEFYKNNVLFSMLDVPAANVDGRVYLPARAVAEAFGFQIQFNATTNIVTVTD